MNRRAICRTVGFGVPYYGSPQMVEVISTKIIQSHLEGIRAIYGVKWWHPGDSRFVYMDKLDFELEFVTCPMPPGPNDSTEELE